MTVLDTEQLLPGRPSNLTVWGETDSSTLVCRQVHDVTHDVQDLPLRARATRAVPPRAGAVRHAAAADRRPLRQPVLHDLLTADAPAPARDHGQAPARRPGVELAARQMVPGKRISAEGPFGVFSIARRPAAKYLFLSGGSGITPVMSMTRTLYDLGLGRRHRVRAQCTHAVRHHLPPRARDDRGHGAHHPCRPRVRAGRAPGAVGRAARLPQPARCCSWWQPDLAERDRVLLLARRLHGRRPPHAR